MSKRIDKFSFFVGVFFVCLIIGCIAQVGGSGTEGRYRFIESSKAYVPTAPLESEKKDLYERLGMRPISSPTVGSPIAFGVFDTSSGTVNLLDTDGEVYVHEFFVTAPQ